MADPDGPSRAAHRGTAVGRARSAPAPTQRAWQHQGAWRRECRSGISRGKADMAFEHSLEELRLLAGLPEPRGMHDSIAKRSSVTAFTTRDGPRNADELRPHFSRAETDRR